MELVFSLFAEDDLGHRQAARMMPEKHLDVRPLWYVFRYVRTVLTDDVFPFSDFLLMRVDMLAKKQYNQIILLERRQPDEQSNRDGYVPRNDPRKSSGFMLD